MSVKELVKNALRGRKVSRPPLLPFIGTYLTKVDGNSLENITKDPGLLHQALRNTQQLLNFDGVVMPLDTTLEVEAFGVPLSWESGLPVIKEYLPTTEAPLYDASTWINQGRLPVFIEAARRFSQVEGRTIPLIAVVTGPLTIWSKLYNQNIEDQSFETVKEIPHLEIIVQSIISLCKEFAQAGVDGIIVNEGNITLPNEYVSSVASIYKPIFNVINHFNLLDILINPKQDQEAPPLHSVVGVGSGIIQDNGSTDKIFKGSIGIPLHADFWKEGEDEGLIHRFVSNFKSKGAFLTTASPLNQEDVNLFDLQDNIEKITSENYWRS